MGLSPHLSLAAAAMISLENALSATVTYGLLPVWAAAGVGDWLCHRRQRMELTAGVGESMLHLLMLAILAPTTLVVMWCEINALALTLAACACVAHELAFWADLSFASRRRVIPPVEQWIHSVQFAVPWVGIAALALLHRDQLMALLGAAGAPAADWTFRPKAHPLPPDYRMTVLLAGAVIVALPFAEEFWRCLKARPYAGAPARHHVPEDQDGLATIR